MRSCNYGPRNCDARTDRIATPLPRVKRLNVSSSVSIVHHVYGSVCGVPELGAVLETVRLRGKMAANNAHKPPTRGIKHDALNVFLGSWRAEGLSFGGTDQSGDDPKANSEPWKSTHVGRWHTGDFFLIQDEKALVGGKVFDTLSVMGVDAATGRYFARSFENHGFYRHYDAEVAGRTWRLTGETERARIDFSEDGRTQTIAWEWKPEDTWLPLCDRTAVRTD